MCRRLWCPVVSRSPGVLDALSEGLPPHLGTPVHNDPMIPIYPERPSSRLLGRPSVLMGAYVQSCSMRLTESLACASCSRGQVWESCTSADARAPDGHGTFPISRPPKAVVTGYLDPSAVRPWGQMQRPRRPSQWCWNVSHTAVELPSWVARKSWLPTRTLRRWIPRASQGSVATCTSVRSF